MIYDMIYNIYYVAGGERVPPAPLGWYLVLGVIFIVSSQSLNLIGNFPPIFPFLLVTPPLNTICINVLGFLCQFSP